MNNRNIKLEQELIRLSCYTQDKKVIPLIIEYAKIYAECRTFTGCDKLLAQGYALDMLKMKYDRHDT